MASLELYGRQATGRRMSAGGVIKHFNVTKDITAGLLPSGIYFPADALALEQLEEALSDSIVVAVSPSAHAGFKVVASQEALPLMACKLAALVRVHGHGIAWSSTPERHMQCIQGQLGINAATCCPANNLA